MTKQTEAEDKKDFINLIHKLADKVQLTVNEDILARVMGNDNKCICVPNGSRSCPCPGITPTGCKCGLFYLEDNNG